MNSYESAAMWKVYLSRDVGIALQSTYQRLINSFVATSLKVRVGVVKYIDYDLARVDTNSLFTPYLHKRKSFEHERELRAIIWGMEHPELNMADPETHGIRIKIDLEELLEKVYLSPSSPAWINRLVKSTIKRYEIDVGVIESDLNKAPSY